MSLQRCSSALHKYPWKYLFNLVAEEHMKSCTVFVITLSDHAKKKLFSPSLSISLSDLVLGSPT